MRRLINIQAPSGEDAGPLAKLFLGGATLLSGLVVAHRALNHGGRLAQKKKDVDSDAAAAYDLVHDPVTGIPNGVLFADRVQQALKHANGSATVVAVLEIDRFQSVSHSLGPELGDQILIDVTERLAYGLSPTDTVARVGAGEFAILAENFENPDRALKLAEVVQESILAPFAIGSRDLELTATVGIAVARPDHGSESLIADADAAMHRARQRGTGYELSNRELREKGLKRLKIEAGLRKAIDGAQLRLHYQPIVDLEGGHRRSEGRYQSGGTGRRAPVGVEALVRWQHPDLGLLEPNEFVPIAEESGLVVPLGKWVLEQACRQVAAWHDGREDLQLHVNLSPRQLADPGLVEMVANTLEETEIDPSTLSLEITETAITQDEEMAFARLDELQTLGVRLGIDDFGVGYTSLSQLARLVSVDFLKIDGSFIAEMGAEREAAIVSSVIGLGTALGLSVVAEGVESAEQAVALQAMGCPEAQGFYFCRPKAPDELKDLLDTPPITWPVA